MQDFFYQLSIVIIFCSILSYPILRLGQPLIIAYIIAGFIVGPASLGWVRDIGFISSLSHLGISLLLFLAGLVLHPRRLFSLFGQTLLITLVSAITFFISTLGISLLFGFGLIEAIYISLALMFSSTILVVKLLPTTTLHHKHMGAFCIAVLIAQDIIAIAILIFMSISEGFPKDNILGIAIFLFKVFGFIIFALYFERFILRKIMYRVERFHETLYLLALGWCFGLSLLSGYLGFSNEIGAFIAGVTISRSPIALFLSEGLKVLRDFFLVLFFFVLGANLNLAIVPRTAIISLIMAVILIFIKPYVFYYLFRIVGERYEFSKEVGIRLGQASEFSLIIAVACLSLGRLSQEAFSFIQITTIITLILSSYIVIFSYPTPLALQKGLRQD